MGAGPGGSPRYDRTTAGYASGEYDALLGLARMGARLYDAELGRFVSPDALVAPLVSQGIAAYSYARNNPVTWSDPTGLQTETFEPDSYNYVAIQDAPQADAAWEEISSDDGVSGSGWDSFAMSGDLGVVAAPPAETFVYNANEIGDFVPASGTRGAAPTPEELMAGQMGSISPPQGPGFGFSLELATDPGGRPWQRIPDYYVGILQPFFNPYGLDLRDLWVRVLDMPPPDETGWYEAGRWIGDSQILLNGYVFESGAYGPVALAVLLSHEAFHEVQGQAAAGGYDMISALVELEGYLSAYSGRGPYFVPSSLKGLPVDATPPLGPWTVEATATHFAKEVEKGISPH